MRTAIYAGSFDPLTNGHLSIIQRALQMFDRVIVAVAVNPKKVPLFTQEERMELIRQACPEPRVEVDAFQGLLVEYDGALWFSEDGSPIRKGAPKADRANGHHDSAAAGSPICRRHCTCIARLCTSRRSSPSEAL